MSEMSETEIKAMTKEQNYIRGYKDGKSDVLDKIRAEIMQLDYDIDTVYYDYNDMPQTETVHTIYREEVFRIIDKYKAESEE